MKRIRLGILQTNHDKSVEVGDAFPDDAHRFRDMFDLQEDRFQYKIYMTIGGEVPKDLDEQDAYLITGSPLSVLDEHVFSDALMDFIRRCDAAEKPLMGACFGHQAIALALGGKVEKSPRGYNVGIEDTQFSKPQSWMVPKVMNLPMYVFHEDQVTELPDECEVLGSSKNCEIASFVKGNHIFTTQAHPEFTHEFMNSVLGFTEANMNKGDVVKARASMKRTTNGDTFCQWTTNFFKASF